MNEEMRSKNEKQQTNERSVRFVTVLSIKLIISFVLVNTTTVNLLHSLFWIIGNTDLLKEPLSNVIIEITT